MSEQYKYEPIFGDQSLFDGAPEDAVSVRYGKSEYIFDSEEIKATTGQLRDVPVVAITCMMNWLLHYPKLMNSSNGITTKTANAHQSHYTK